MSYLIQIDPKLNQVLHPEVLKLCDSFEALEEKEMIYVVLYADYNSIYKQLPEKERKRRAMWHAFNDNETEIVESHRVKAVVQDYISLQYNPKIELIRRYQNKIDKLLDALDKEVSATNGEKTAKFIASLRKYILELESEVDDKTREEGVIKSDRDLSFLEKLLANKKLFQAVTAKK